MTDRFRPDAALRGIIPLPTDGRTTVLLRQSGGQVAEVLAGKRADTLIVDDPAAQAAVGAAIRDAINHGVISGMELVADAARASFEDRGPIGHKGRSSLPKSHRAEGNNFVD